MENIESTRRLGSGPSMKRVERFATLLLLTLTVVLPASANNPPQPDGLFFVLLVFPVVILGSRLGAVAARKQKTAARIIGAVAMGILTVVCLMAGTELGALGALAVLVYAIFRGSAIINRGASRHRVAFGVTVMTFALLAFADYYASLMRSYPSSGLYESIAASRVRRLSTAQSEFVAAGHSRGTIKELEDAQLIADGFSGGHILKGYRYNELDTADGNPYVFYAIPADELKPAGHRADFVPGESLIKAIFGVGEDDEHLTGEKSFAIDETGVLRFSTREKGKPVTLEEVRTWSTLP